VRVKVILNPGADRGRAIRFSNQLLAWGEQYGEFDVTLTDAPGHAATLAQQAAEAGYERIAAAGGDGTAHEVVNGLMAVPNAGRPALGLISIGSGNDYAFGLGLLAPPQAALARLFEGEPRRLDLAEVVDNRGQRRYVCNGLGIGFDAAVAIAASQIRRIHGFSAYVLGALKTVALHYQRPHFELQFDGARISQRSLMLAIGVGPRIGGGFRLTPDAAFDDGHLDSCLVDPIGRLTMLRMMPKAMKGRHVTASFVQMRRSAVIDVRSDMPLPVHVDGEIFAREKDGVTKLSIRVIPGALPLLF
jgi:YegS/Rv2252/BmrU family lipid kinase